MALLLNKRQVIELQRILETAGSNAHMVRGHEVGQTRKTFNFENARICSNSNNRLAQDNSKNSFSIFCMFCTENVLFSLILEVWLRVNNLKVWV